MYDFLLFSGQKYMVLSSPKIYIGLVFSEPVMITLISNLTSKSKWLGKLISPERIKLSLTVPSTRQGYRFSQVRKNILIFLIFISKSLNLVPLICLT